MTGVYKVGVTGHRLNRLSTTRIPALRLQLAEVFRELSERHQISVVTSLAEGADRLAAEVSLECNLRFICPLPFPVAEYERDFRDRRSIQHFRALLEAASEVVILGGERIDEEEAYTRVGEWMIGKIDVLVVIWDGGASRGPGGTRYLIERALSTRTPVIWLHAQADQVPRILHLGNDEIRESDFSSQKVITHSSSEVAVHEKRDT